MLIDAGQIPGVYSGHHHDVRTDTEGGRGEITSGPRIPHQTDPFRIPEHAAYNVIEQAGQVSQ
jgi:hypothetical protein